MMTLIKMYEFVQGIAIVRQLRQLEERTGRRIHELFDLICGTSTGGILAVAVALKQLSLTECEQIYRQVPWFEKKEKLSVWHLPLNNPFDKRGKDFCAVYALRRLYTRACILGLDEESMKNPCKDVLLLGYQPAMVVDFFSIVMSAIVLHDDTWHVNSIQLQWSIECLRGFSHVQSYSSLQFRHLLDPTVLWLKTSVISLDLQNKSNMRLQLQITPQMQVLRIHLNHELLYPGIWAKGSSSGLVGMQKMMMDGETVCIELIRVGSSQCEWQFMVQNTMLPCLSYC